MTSGQLSQRRWPAPGRDLGYDRDHVLRAEALGRVQGVAFAGALVHHHENLEADPGTGLVIHEVAAPEMVVVRDLLPLRRRQAQASGLALALADLQAALGQDALARFGFTHAPARRGSAVIRR